MKKGVATLLILVLLPLAVHGAAQTVRMPLTVDYGFLRTLFIHQAYTQPGERAVPVDIGNGCSRMELWKPDVGPEKSLLKLASNIKVSVGLPISGTCLKLSDWEGRIDVLQRLILDPQKMRLGLQTVDFRTYNQEGKGTAVDHVIGSFLKTYLDPFLNQVGLDLSVPVKGLQTLLPLFFSTEDRPHLQSSLAKLKLGEIRVAPEGITLDTLMDMEVKEKPKAPPGTPQSESAVAGLISSWESFDAFALHQLQPLFGKLLTDQERQGLFDSLVDMRHDFVQSLNDGNLNPALLATQFSSVWKGFSPVIRKHLGQGISGSPLNFLTFLTVSDAIVALHSATTASQVSPGHEGLMKLAGLLTPGKAEPTLDYSHAVKPDLRKLMGLDPPLDESGPAFDGLEMELRDDEARLRPIDGFLLWLRSWPSPVYAAEAPPAPQEIRPWVLPKGDIAAYLNRVRTTLDRAANDALAKGRIDPAYHDLYHQIVTATAWQESCWRQFTGSTNSVRCLLSYNQSSVGLMQINERVWRGLYGLPNLRWNPAYNVRAGCEILELYLRRYALSRPEGRNLERDTLAQSVYAMYNGGPGQFKKFLARTESGKFTKIDQLFREKYNWVKTGQFDKIRTCLGR